MIITAPHAGCPPPGYYRRCDTHAETLARALSRALPAARLHINLDVDRAQLDMNRFPSRGSSFRAAIRKDFTEAHLLIDAHSMWRGAYGTMDDVVLLDPPGNKMNLAGIVKGLREAGFSVTRFIGHPTRNDITLEALGAGVSAAFLVEVAEDLSRDQIQRIANIVAGGSLKD